MADPKKRKRAISKADFLHAVRNGLCRQFDPLGRLDGLIVVDENSECWDPKELLESLPKEETRLTPEAQQRLQDEIRDVLRWSVPGEEM